MLDSLDDRHRSLADRPVFLDLLPDDDALLSPEFLDFFLPVGLQRVDSSDDQAMIDLASSLQRLC